MAIQFITGDLKVNKKQPIIQNIINLLAENPQRKFYYIVPEHLKFDMEARMLTSIKEYSCRDTASLMNIKVVSFTRLAWYLLPKKIQPNQNLSEVGMSMVLRKVLLELEDQLIIYRHQIHFQGFIDKLVSLFTELIEGRIEAEDLILEEGLYLSNNDPRINLQESQRMKELALIYQHFLLKVDQMSLFDQGIYQDLWDYFDLVEPDPLSYVIIDHHYYFSARQQGLIMQMARKFQQVWITLPLTHHEKVSKQWLPLAELPLSTYQRLLELAAYYHVEVDPDWDITEPIYPYHPEILKAADFVKAQINHGVLQVHDEGIHQIELWTNDTIQTEIAHVSNQINYLVKHQHYRYSDILVVTRDLSSYGVVIEPFFAGNNIPYFFDNVQTMEHHPFVLWLNSFFNLYRYNFRYQDIISLLKNSFIKPDYIESQEEYLNQVYLLENIMISNGFQGRRFTHSEYLWRFPQEETVYYDVSGQATSLNLGVVLDQLRSWFNQEIAQPLATWNKQFTGRQASQWLYQILDNMGLKTSLMDMRDQAIEVGEIEASRNIEQLWKVFTQLLDEFYQIFDEATISFEVFSELLLTGFKQGKFHVIPPTLDQVTVTSLESPQVGPYKVVFVIGIDEQALPLQRVNDSLISQEHRQIIKNNLLASQDLPDPFTHQLQGENLLAYQLLLHAEDAIYLSYISQKNNLSMQVSHYYRPLINQLKIKEYKFSQHDLPNLRHSSHFGQPKTFVSSIIYALHLQPHYQWQDYSDNPLMNTILLNLSDGDRLAIFEFPKRIKQFTQLPQSISAENALDLYGRHLISSVSKMETYYQDPFSYFLIHGLKLRPREYFEVDPRRSGDYYHEVLDQLTKYAIDERIDLKDLSPDQIKSLLTKIASQVSENTAYNIFQSSPQFTFLKQHMDSYLERFLLTSLAAYKETSMRPVVSEQLFGFNHSGSLKGPTYQFDNGDYLSLIGKIDRIDMSLDNRFLQVVDYKSGKKKFSLENIYYGLDLQVLTYLKVSLDNYQEFQPLGAFYLPLKQGGIEEGSESSWKERESNPLIHSNFVFSGLVTTSADSLKMVEPHLLQADKSKIYPISLKKDGDFNSRSKNFVSAEELTLIFRHLDHLYQEAARKILSGNIRMQPFQDDTYATSLDRDHRVISGFDGTIHYNHYRQKTVKNDQVINKLKESYEQLGGDQSVSDRSKT